MSDPKSVSTPFAVALFVLLVAAPLSAVVVSHEMLQAERPLEASSNLPVPTVDPNNPPGTGDLPDPNGGGGTPAPGSGSPVESAFPKQGSQELSSEDKAIWLGRIDYAVDDPTKAISDPNKKLIAITFVGGVKQAVADLSPLYTDPNVEFTIAISKAGVQAAAGSDAILSPAALAAVEQTARGLVMQYAGVDPGSATLPNEARGLTDNGKIQELGRLFFGKSFEFFANAANAQNGRALGTWTAGTFMGLAVANPAGGSSGPDPNAGLQGAVDWAYNLTIRNAAYQDALNQSEDAWNSQIMGQYAAVVAPKCSEHNQAANCEQARATAAQAIGTAIASARYPGAPPQVPSLSQANAVANCTTDAAAKLTGNKHPSARYAVIYGLANALMVDPDLALEANCPVAHALAQGVLDSNSVVPETAGTVTGTLLSQWTEIKKTLASKGVIVPEPHAVAKCINDHVATEFIARLQSGKPPAFKYEGEALVRNLTGQSIAYFKDGGKCPDVVKLNTPSVWATDCRPNIVANARLNGKEFLDTASTCAITIYGAGDPDMNNTDWRWNVSYYIPGSNDEAGSGIIPMRLEGNVLNAVLPNAAKRLIGEGKEFRFHLTGAAGPADQAVFNQRVPYGDTWYAFRGDAKAPNATINATTEGANVIRVKWSATDAGSGAPFLYYVEVSQDGGPWVKHLPDTTVTQDVKVWPGGHKYAFRVKARDAIGHWSAYAVAPTINLPGAGGPTTPIAAKFLAPTAKTYKGDMSVALEVTTDPGTTPTVCVAILTHPGKQAALPHNIQCGHLHAFKFDTTQVPDGDYVLRATVSNGAHNVHPWSEPFKIANHAPVKANVPGAGKGDQTTAPPPSGTSGKGTQGTGGSGPSVYGDDAYDDDSDTFVDADVNAGVDGSGKGQIGSKSRVNVPLPAAVLTVGLLGITALARRRKS